MSKTWMAYIELVATGSGPYAMARLYLENDTTFELALKGVKHAKAPRASLSLLVQSKLRETETGNRPTSLRVFSIETLTARMRGMGLANRSRDLEVAFKLMQGIRASYFDQRGDARLVVWHE